MLATLDALIERCATIPEAGCWIWLGYSERGYGRAWDSSAKKPRTVHRIAFEIKNGPIKAGFFVCHKCDTPSCCNPEHLFLGTPKDNLYDCISKGRMRHPQSLKTHCVNGHPLDGDNIRHGIKHRTCKKCHAAVEARRRQRRRSHVQA